jgi:chromate transporter
MNDNPLISLAGYFALLSLFAVGGANAAIPEMHRIAVEVMHWMSDRQFADSFAISQVSPGPNIIIVTLIGYHVAGLAGAAVATAAMCGPTCVLAFLVALAHRHSGRPGSSFAGAHCGQRLRACEECGPQHLCRRDYSHDGHRWLCDPH